MARLTYWCSENKSSMSPALNLRAKTRKEIMQRFPPQRPSTDEYGKPVYVDESGNYFGQPFKMVVEYDDAFDLMRQYAEQEVSEMEY